MSSNSVPDPLVQSVIEAHANPTKKIAGALKEYHDAARWIPLTITPFGGMSRFIYAGLRPNDPTAKYAQEEIEIHDKIAKLVPGFQETIIKFQSVPNELIAFINLLGKWSSEARHEDTSSIKHVAIEYIPRDPNIDTVKPPITRDQTKSVRGFNHIATARLLCPYRDIERFTNDPQAYMEDVQDGRIKIKAHHWPTFLYDESTPFDAHNIDNGLFRGHFLLRVYRHIFTGPSSALEGVRKATKRSKAHIHGMTEVTARTIAYACIQGRFMLSSCEHWTTVDGDFDAIKFYNNIVELFEADADDPWVKETLEFWNKAVPSLMNNKKRSSPQQSSDSDVEEMEDIFAQRKARQAHSRANNDPATGGDQSLGDDGSGTNEVNSDDLVSSSSPRDTSDPPASNPDVPLSPGIGPSINTGDDSELTQASDEDRAPPSRRTRKGRARDDPDTGDASKRLQKKSRVRR